MTPFYDFNQQFSHMPLVEEVHDHLCYLHPLTLPNVDHASSVPCIPIFFNDDSQVTQGANNIDHDDHLQQVLVHEQESIDHMMMQGSSNLPSCDQYTKDEDHHKSSKWMPSKMRIMRKMMKPNEIATKKPRRTEQVLQDHHEQQSTHSSTDVFVRVCSDCKTTKTPLWRSGPSGPKSLCNACGIRQRKARRALAAAAAVSVGLIPAEKNKIWKMKESVDIDRTIPFKKRCRFSTAGSGKKKVCLDDFVIRLSKSTAFHRVFPQDDRDAAILLMALSCGRAFV